jgi:hypothetical protein
MKIDVLCGNITEFVEGTRTLLECIKEEEDEEEGHDNTHSHRSVYSGGLDRRVFFPDDIAVNGELERYGFTTQLMRRQRDDELGVGGQRRGGAPFPETGVRAFLETQN